MQDDCSLMASFVEEVCTMILFWLCMNVMYVMYGKYVMYVGGNMRPIILSKWCITCMTCHVFTHPYKHVYRTISSEAMDLIRKMLTVNQRDRWTAEQLLNHPWMRADDELLKQKNLNSSIAALKKFNIRRYLYVLLMYWYIF